jgi:hypothetical protein
MQGAPTPEPVETPAIVDMPPHRNVVELLEIFLFRFCALIPCFHEQRLRDAIDQGQLQAEAPVLVYAIIAMAAKYHPEQSVKCQEDGWYRNAKLSFDLTAHNSEPALRILQAAVCLLCYSTIVCDFSTVWILQAKAWRQACAHGYNAIDTNLDVTATFVTLPESEVEKEERRRVMWLLFVFDRSGSFPLGWAHVIDRKHFVVNPPMNERSFQIDDAKPSSPIQVPNPFQSLIAIYELLGRTVDHTHTLQIPDDPDTYQREFYELDAALSALAKSSMNALSHSQTLPSRDKFQVVWGHIIIHAAMIILHHRSVGEWDLIRGSGPTKSFKADELHELHLQHCFSAADAIIQLVRSLEGASWDLLSNPQIASALYVCERVLIIRWHDTKDPKYQDDTERLLALFENFHNAFPKFGRRIWLRIRNDMDMDRNKVRAVRALGSRAGVSGCSSLRN